VLDTYSTYLHTYPVYTPESPYLSFLVPLSHTISPPPPPPVPVNVHMYLLYRIPCLHCPLLPCPALACPTLPYPAHPLIHSPLSTPVSTHHRNPSCRPGIVPETLPAVSTGLYPLYSAVLYCTTRLDPKSVVDSAPGNLRPKEEQAGREVKARQEGRDETRRDQTTKPDPTQTRSQSPRVPESQSLRLSLSLSFSLHLSLSLSHPLTLHPQTETQT
jgi:hypothetical protein